MYIGQVIGYLVWPILILVSYLCVRWALKIFEKRYSVETSSESPAEPLSTKSADETNEA